MALEWWLVLALAAIAGAIAARRARHARQAREALRRFQHVSARGAYQEGLTQGWLGGPKHEHAVLLLHGFSGAPHDFRGLPARLEAAGIPYLAPALTGFGLDDVHLLRAARLEDWVRDALTSYELLTTLAREVSVVGLSFGTLLAAELALAHPVRNLVLVSPYFHLKSASDRRARETLAHPIPRAIARVLMPYVFKPVRPGRATCVDVVDARGALEGFQYPILPLEGLLQLWRCPQDQPLERVQARQLDVLYGALDETSDVARFLADLDARGVPHRRRAFARSAHNPFGDHDAAEAIAAVMDILTDRVPAARQEA